MRAQSQQLLGSAAIPSPNAAIRFWMWRLILARVPLKASDFGEISRAILCLDILSFDKEKGWYDVTGCIILTPARPSAATTLDRINDEQLMNIKATIGILSIALSACVASGATLELGTIKVQPNLAGQRVALPDVVGVGEQVAGVNFNIQVADGGPDAGGSIVGPTITAVDIVGTGTMFDGNNNGQSGGGSLLPQIFEAVTTTSSGTVEADGTLAFVTFDTTGFNSGMFDLLVSSTLNGPTELLDTTPANVLTVQDGWLMVVPEPSSLALGLLALIGCLRFARRR